MDIHDLNRVKKNEKINGFADEIIINCEMKKFTVADMKDLAEILQGKISKAITAFEEKTYFSNPFQ